jgi:transposase-like protein
VRYPKEFRRDAAALVIDQHRTIADVARELGVVEQTLGNWVRQERIDRGERDGTPTELREENTRLRRELKRVEMERDLLKKATAFWVKESERRRVIASSTPGRPKDSRLLRRVASSAWPPRATTTGSSDRLHQAMPSGTRRP